MIENQINTILVTTVTFILLLYCKMYYINIIVLYKVTNSNNNYLFLFTNSIKANRWLQWLHQACIEFHGKKAVTFVTKLKSFAFFQINP